jgi:hypothetical protein
VIDHTNPAAVMARLAEIEEDLASRQGDYELAADDRARAVRDWDKRLAIHQRKVTGPNAEARKAEALVRAVEQDDLYDRLSDSEARYDALKVVTRTLETRASIGQSILRAQGRG